MAISLFNICHIKTKSTVISKVVLIQILTQVYSNFMVIEQRVLCSINFDKRKRQANSQFSLDLFKRQS